MSFVGCTRSEAVQYDFFTKFSFSGDIKQYSVHLILFETLAFGMITNAKKIRP
ncbi:MAG: hypothetical protein KJ556_14015 [Gammaproteobacteria bacterium]|nr:hypothetical protein [Gammaproteobacteria bacterium]MBU2057472.1 hypothetical protein [Gammaproteobacteria bacterium]MBU2176232.1 hypothetical protein [Gammaproteobacteria bacterium]MBU2245833.1 hypothetical protein [Gammaproteobacteria bacterium]MBU2343107.1 hypothetical protein [Gammaproteobacteria bacterium]